MKRKEFQSNGMDYRAAMAALNKLQEYRLTDFEEVGDYHETQVWFLTEKGKVAAQKLSELVDYIEAGH